MSKQENRNIYRSNTLASFKDVESYLLTSPQIKFVYTQHFFNGKLSEEYDKNLTLVTDDDITLLNPHNNNVEEKTVIDTYKIVEDALIIKKGALKEMCITTYDQLSAFNEFVKDALKECPIAIKDMGMGNFSLYKKNQEELFLANQIKKKIGIPMYMAPPK